MSSIDISSIEKPEFNQNVHALRGIISTYQFEMPDTPKQLLYTLDIIQSYTTAGAVILPSEDRDMFVSAVVDFEAKIKDLNSDNKELIEVLSTLTNSSSFLSISRKEIAEHTATVRPTSLLEHKNRKKMPSPQKKQPKSITLPNSQIVDATNSIVILGPNGAGKSTLGHRIFKEDSNSIWFSAHRHLSVPQELAMQTTGQAEQQVISQRNNNKQKHNQYESELNVLLNKLRAEHSQAADNYLAQAQIYTGDQFLSPPTTDLARLWSYWAEMFPQREIVWNDYTITAKSHYGESQEAQYEPNNMSGGEKAALYLLVKVMTAPIGALLAIDEPELHFHSLLAQTFWSKMEEIRSDCRFVYITHDLQFSASRLDPKYIVVHQPNQYEVLASSDIPQELFLKILGTNTFSLNAKKVVFVEGKSAGSPDLRLYKQWFKNEGNSVIIQPVESCESVIKHTTAFNEAGLFNDIEAIGIIDRDYRSDTDIDTLKKSSIHVLDLHELESCLCSREIFESIYNDNDFDGKNDANKKFEQFFNQLKVELSSDKNQADVIFERTKVASEKLLLNSLNKCKQFTKQGIDQTEMAIYNIGNDIDLSKVFTAEKIRCREAVSNGDYEGILEIFDGKTILNSLHRQIPSMNKNTYIAETIKGLKRLDSGNQCLIGNAVVNTLEKYLPPRDFE